VDNSALSRRLIVGLVLGFIILLGFILISDIKEITGIIYSFRWNLLPLVLALTLVNYALRGLKFHYYLRQIDAEKIPLSVSFRIFVAGFPLAITPGKAGEAVKGIWIHRRTGTSIAKGVSVVVAERISDGLAVLILSILGVLAFPQYWSVFLSILLLLIVLVAVSQVRPLAFKLLDYADRIPFVRRFTGGLREFYEGSFTLFRPLPLLIAVGLGVISWLGEGVGFYVILVGLGLPPTAQLFSIAVFVLAFSMVIGAVSALPGGLGAAEASISGMLILLLKLDIETAAAATLLIRFATLWFGVALGLIVWAFSRNFLKLTTLETNPAGSQNG